VSVSLAEARRGGAARELLVDSLVNRLQIRLEDYSTDGADMTTGMIPHTYSVPIEPWRTTRVPSMLQVGSWWTVSTAPHQIQSILKQLAASPIERLGLAASRNGSLPGGYGRSKPGSSIARHSGELLSPTWFQRSHLAWPSAKIAVLPSACRVTAAILSSPMFSFLAVPTFFR
jgi:hypothetical protein